jgi:phage-related tail protein
MSTAIASGGEKARQAMQKTAKGLLKIKDPAERANTAIMLFGTPIEDLSVDQIPKFLSALAGTRNELGEVSGAAERMGGTLRDNLSGDVAKLQGEFAHLRFQVFAEMDKSVRKLTQTVTGWLGKLNAWVSQNPELVTKIVMLTGAVAGVIAVLGGIGLVVWPVITGINAIVATAGVLGTVFSVVGGAIMTVLGALTWPIVAIGVAIVAGALLIRKYWEPISAFFGGVMEGLKAAFATVGELFSPLKPMFDWLGEKLKAAWDWFKNLLEPVKSTQEQLDSCRDVGKRFGQALADSLLLPLRAFNKLKAGIDWVLEKLGVINKESGTIDQTAGKVSAARTGETTGAVNTGSAYVPATANYGGYQAYQPVTAPGGKSYVDNRQSNYTITMNNGGAPGGDLGRQLQDAIEKADRDKRARDRSSMRYDG